MAHQETVLVLTQDAETQFAMLKDLPHIMVESAADLTPAAKEATSVLYWSGSRDLIREVFLQCGQLRWIHSRSAGLDSRLFPELVESDVLLTNGKGVFSASLGEFTLAAILYFAKDFPRMRRNQVAHQWVQFDVEQIEGQVVGIVGYGDIGRAVATRVHAMGMRVLALRRHAPETPDPLIERYYRPEELHAMLAQCDYVVVAAPLTAETRHMMSDAEFSAMKPTATIINVGRGPVIDEAAMVRALAAGQIKGAGLDVFEQEPLPADSPLYDMENVLFSPHCADHTAEWKEDAMRFFLAQYERFVEKKPLLNIVNKHLGY